MLKGHGMRRMLKHEQHTFSSFMGEAESHDELSLVQRLLGHLPRAHAEVDGRQFIKQRPAETMGYAQREQVVGL